jgi:hypothetical protein
LVSPCDLSEHRIIRSILARSRLWKPDYELQLKKVIGKVVGDINASTTTAIRFAYEMTDYLDVSKGNCG